MSPRESARIIWEKQDNDRSFAAVLRLYEESPRVLVDTPEVFVAARPVPSLAIIAWINAEMVWPVDQCDTWFILLYSGKLNSIWKLMPYPLRYCSWNRAKNNALHFHELSRIRSLTSFTNGRKLF